MAKSPALNEASTICSSSATMNDSQIPVVQSARCKAPVRLMSREDKVRRRMETNDKIRKRRKSGVYADSNRVRNGRTREIAFLREQMEKLHIHFETLKKKKKSSRQTPIRSSSGQQEGVQITRNPRMWRERQRNAAASMTSMLQKRARGLASECSSFIRQNGVQNPIARVLVFCGDMGGFQELFRHLEAAYLEVDAVFAVNGLDHMVETADDVHIREGGDGTYAEAFSNKVLPFALSASTEATWGHFKGSEKHLGNGNIYEKSAEHHDEPCTIVEEFTKELFSRRFHADIKVKQVIRRYSEPDRDIVIWVARVSPAEIKHKRLSGLMYHLRGYAVTKSSSLSTPGQEVAQLQCCSMISLDQDDETRYSAENMRTLSNFLIASTALKIRAHQDRIENALVQRALQEQTL
ncbi:hypothetical protein PI125_g19459 [Phytophthora idaei]|nr:hypothetical protein PI125_g19459 [Phytophthora idaei]